jgi:hypothetical protein
MSIKNSLQIWQREDGGTAIQMYALRDAICEGFENTENDQTSNVFSVREKNASLQKGKQSDPFSMLLLPRV